jgi:hypothetical protein
LPLLWGHPQSESRSRALLARCLVTRRWFGLLLLARRSPTFPAPAPPFLRAQNKIDLVKEDAARQHYAQVRRQA